jgi:hypothetical protein
MSTLHPHPTIDGWLMMYYTVRRSHASWLIYPPLEYREGILGMFHDMLGHAGISQTLIFLHQHVHWPGIKADLSYYIKCCPACQKVKLILPELEHPTIPVLYGPLRHVHIDLAGPVSGPSLDSKGNPNFKAQPIK